MKKKIGIIGFGNMGSAIAESLKSRYQITVFDKDKNKTNNLTKINVADNIINLVDQVDTVILAVKPQDFDIVLDEIKEHVKEKLIVSIAAGISTAYIEKHLGRIKVIRVMPNIGVKIGRSETCLCRSKFAGDDDLAFVQELFNCLGKTWKIEEEMMNASTAICGSGPAYIYYDIELNKIDPLNISEEKKQEYVKRLREAAEELGFNSRDAKDLAVSTISTSIGLIIATKMSPSELRRQVTSKGGTTEAALEVLQKNGSWEAAAKAALEQAERLAKKE